MILQVHTEKELIKMIGDMQKTITNYQGQNKALAKRLDAMQNPVQIIKETAQSSKPGIVESDILSLIYKHVTMHYINKLYKKGK